MVEPTNNYVRAVTVATRYLRRCIDSFTRTTREDLAQEVAVEAWRRRGAVREPRHFSAYVHTISRRLRARALGRSRWRLWEDIEDQRDSDLIAGAESAMVRVEGEWHDKDRILAAIEQELGVIGALNAQLLRGFYEGFTCRELGDRYGLAEDVVRVRLYRSRCRIRRGVLRALRDRPVTADEASFGG